MAYRKIITPLDTRPQRHRGFCLEYLFIALGRPRKKDERRFEIPNSLAHSLEIDQLPNLENSGLHRSRMRDGERNCLRFRID